MNKTLESILKWIIALAILVFLSIYFFKNFNQVNWSAVQFKPIYLAASFFVLLADYILLAELWRLVLRKLGYKLSFTDGNRIYFISMLARYIPGKALLLVSRVYLAAKQGVDKKAVVTSTIIDLALFMVSGMICFASSIFLFKGLPSWAIITPLILIPTIMLVLIPEVLACLVNLGLRILKKRPITIRLTYSQILCFVMIHVVRWIVDGFAVYLLFKSVIEPPLILVLLLPGIMGLCTVIGMVLFISPAGLGIREGFLAFMLGPFITTNLAIMVSLISRIWYTIAEVFLALFFMTRRPKKNRWERQDLNLD